MPSELREIDAATLRNTSFIGQRTTSTTGEAVDRVDSSLVGTGASEIPSWEKDGGEKTDPEKGTEGASEEDEDDHRWYFPFPSCNCLPEAFCSKEEVGVADDIYAVKEDVSLLTPDDSLLEEE